MNPTWLSALDAPNDTSGPEDGMLCQASLQVPLEGITTFTHCCHVTNSARTIGFGSEKKAFAEAPFK